MPDTQSFALLVLLAAGVGLVAVLSSHLTTWLKIPSPALFLVVAAIAVKVIPALHAAPEQAAERVVTLAIVCILFDGGMHIGWSRFRSARLPSSRWWVWPARSSRWRPGPCWCTLPST
jgi:cell volume regulation protein A